MDHTKRCISTPDNDTRSRSVAALPPAEAPHLNDCAPRQACAVMTRAGMLFIAAFVPTAHASDRFTKLSGAQIAATLGGMQFTDEMYRREVYEKDGTLRRFEMDRARVGTWRIRGNEMCIDFGNDGDTNCFEIWLRGNKVVMQRDAEDNYPIEGFLEKPTNATPAVADGKP